MFSRTHSPYSSNYTSPSRNYSTTNTYFTTVKRDLALSDLKKELSQYITSDREYEETCLKISRIEREKTKIQRQYQQLEDECLTKIRNNKAMLQELNEKISNQQENRELICSKIDQNISQNQNMLATIKKIHERISDNNLQIENIQNEIVSQQKVIQNFTQTKIETNNNIINLQKSNALRSNKIAQDVQKLRKVQNNIKQVQDKKIQLKQKLVNILQKKNKLLQKKNKNNEQLETIQKDYELEVRSNQKLNTKVTTAEKDMTELVEQTKKNRDTIQKVLVNNKQNTNQLKQLEGNIKIVHQKFETYKKKHNNIEVTLADLLKNNQKVQEYLNKLIQMTQQETTTNQSLTSHLKNSIKNDEEAIKSLSRKAALIESLIN